MALETLKGVESINGEKVIDLDCAKTEPMFFDAEGNFDWGKFDEHREEFPISVSHSQNMVSFKIQKGPVKEVGKNGCQVDALIATALRIITGLDNIFPCEENKSAMMHLACALSSLEDRRTNRELRGVEGRNVK